MESARLLFGIANQHQLHCHHIDVQTAFLNGQLDEEVYLKQPPGFIDPKFPDYVWKLEKSLYGLRQSPLAWHKEYHHVLLKLGFQQLKSEACIYHNRELEILLGVFVDDFLLICRSLPTLNKLKQDLSSHWKIKDLGEVKHFIGLNVERNWDEGTITIHQEKYIKEILHRFGMEESHPLSTPMEPGLKLETPEDLDTSHPYREAIGALIFLAGATRPDITFATHKLAQFSEKHGDIHWNAVKRIFRYLKNTQQFGIRFKKTNDSTTTVIGYSDANWGGDSAQQCKSTSGYVFYSLGGPISWCSKKQSTVAISSCEAEYLSLSEAVSQGLWISHVLQELGIKSEEKAFVLYCDNNSAIHTALNPMLHGRMKHVNIKMHMIRDYVQQQQVILEYVPSEKNIADILTKPLAKAAFNKNCASLITRFVGEY